MNTLFEMERPYVLTIAGHDPSNGAGIGSDLKAIEIHQAYGLSVVTAITYQNANHFEGVKWLSANEIIQQLRSLLEQHPPQTIKIGLIESALSLKEVLSFIKTSWPEAVVIWDPIIKATAGFTFHEDLHLSINEIIEGQIDLITPNQPEYLQLFRSQNPQKIANSLGCRILLKGGHSSGTSVSDILYTPNEKPYHILSERLPDNRQKHGTGCVLSSAIAANLANGLSFNKACFEAHFYVKSFIASATGLLGYHSTENI